MCINKLQICVRGPNVMKGYYKRPEQTAQAIDSEGWLHTSDIGMILPNGTLTIIDRKLVNYLITFFCFFFF
jgi:long-chain acyl-CoA synthetase